MFDQLRANIRNAWCAEGSDDIYREWCNRVAQDRVREAQILRELLTEAMIEAEETVI